MDKEPFFNELRELLNKYEVKIVAGVYFNPTIPYIQIIGNEWIEYAWSLPVTNKG